MSADIRNVETQADLLALRADTDFHEGAMAVLTYPSAPAVGFIGHELPLVSKGQIIEPGPGCSVVKGEAGDFAVIYPGAGGLDALVGLADA